MLRFIGKQISGKAGDRDFNTSHVKVYRVLKELPFIPLLDFNTSHVKVYPNGPSLTYPFVVNFNTSHVKVYQHITHDRSLS